MSPARKGVDLTGRHIFITGGTGAVGRTLIDYFRICHTYSTGPRVTLLTRDPGAFAKAYPAQAVHAWLSLTQGSLSCLPRLPTDISDVIHGAAATQVESDHEGWIDQIVGGTRTLLAAAAAAGASRFLLLSSGAVYGSQPAEMARIGEGFRGAPDQLRLDSTYGEAKRLAEHLCAIYCAEKGFHTVIARLFAFGSVHIPRDGRYALGNFVRDALADNDAPIRVMGSGTAIRSYLGGRDMAHGLMTALCRGSSGQAYNIGSEVGVSIAELARSVRDRLSPDRQIKIIGEVGDGQRSRYVPDAGKIIALGAVGSTPIDDVIAETAGLPMQAISLAS